MKRGGFPRKTYTPPPAAPLRALTRPVNYGHASTGVLADEKPQPYRDRALLDMARGRPCLMPGRLHADTDTTVAAHSNHMEHGKSKGRKADDCYSVWACAICHAWYDQGNASRFEKRRAFDEAFAEQRLQWRKIASDQHEPMRFRAAALLALEFINQRRET